MNPPSWARPGVKVVCVKKGLWTNEEGGEELNCPRYGDILTIRTADLGKDGKLFLRFQEIVNPKKKYIAGFTEARFFVGNFRPLITRTQEQDVALFVHHLEEHKEKA